jgi:glycosyltransferase involved in cell wall biosynthesis
MKIAFVRTMPHFSMDTYADGLISGLKAICPSWEIVELKPQAIDRSTRSPKVRVNKAYERFWRFPQHVLEESADIYHIVDHSDAHIARWLKKSGKSVVVTCHDLINLIYPDNLKSSVRLPFISDYLGQYSIRGMELADAIVAVSNETSQNINKILNVEIDKITVIPNAVDSLFHPLTQAQKHAFREALKVPQETICLLNVGGNHPRKNVITALKALKLMKQKGLNVQFWKVSDDFNDEDKAYIQANDLEPVIQYLGYLDKPALVNAYNAADIYIAPSFHEGFGITLLEAMACGIPVITSNTSAMPEVVGEAGILVDPHNSQDIADAVHRLVSQPQVYTDRRQRGLQRVQLFTWDHVAEQLTHVYRHVVNSSL